MVYGRSYITNCCIMRIRRRSADLYSLYCLSHSIVMINDWWILQLQDESHVYHPVLDLDMEKCMGMANTVDLL